MSSWSKHEAGEDDLSGGKSLYNSGIALIYRMDNLKKEAHNEYIKGNLHKLNRYIDRKWAEVEADATADQRNKFKVFDDRLQKAYFWVKFSNEDFDTVPIIVGKLIRIHERILKEKELFVHEVENSQGKGTAYKDEIEDYMD